MLNPSIARLALFLVGRRGIEGEDGSAISRNPLDRHCADGHILAMTHISGTCHSDFTPVRDAFAANFNEDLELGAGFAVFKDGECVVDLVGGYSDRDRTQAWTHETLVPVYSTTKPIAALVAAMAIDRSEEASFETPVAQIWPEFASHGKGALTLAQVLSHQAGLPGFADEIDPALWLRPRELSALLADEAPMWAPDGTSGYHPLTWGYLAGEIVQRLTGNSLGTCLANWVTHTDQSVPDMDFWIGLPASEHQRTAAIQRPKAPPELGEMNDYKKAAFLTRWAAPDRGGAPWREVEIPSANGHGTARSVAKLYGAYTDASLNGERLMSDETFHALTQRRTSGPDRVLPFEIDFAAGVMQNSDGLYGPNPHSFGHSGWGGSAALADPDINLSCAYVMNRQSNHLQGDPRGQRLFAALYDCLRAG